MLNVIDLLKENREQVQEAERILKDFGFQRFTLDKESLSSLHVAAIMDEFTYHCFAHECGLKNLSVDNWEKEIQEFSPDLLFIESAWLGFDCGWQGMLRIDRLVFSSLINYAHGHNIPIVFWAKEDPVNNAYFMPVAKAADFVFTTDIDCVARYKKFVGHSRVYCLPFAAQPALHNPIEKYDRQEKFCFAGSYYAEFKERSAIFDQFSKYFCQKNGLDIYDRNKYHPESPHQFPEHYKPLILGTLSADQIDTAYKGYIYNINMNSVINSQSMCARRVFELLASNTVVVGNYAKAVKEFFGELTICTDNLNELETKLKQYCGTETDLRKYRLLGLRKVLSEHLYEDRLCFVVEKVFGKKLKRKLPEIVIFAKIGTKEEAESILHIISNQTYQPSRIVLVHPNKWTSEIEDERIKLVSEKEAFEKKIAECCDSGYATILDLNHFYGKNYLYDLAITSRYGEFDAVGKKEYFEYKNGSIAKRNHGTAYHITDSLPTESSMISVVSPLCPKTISDLFSVFNLRGKNLFSIDEFNFVKNGASVDCGICLDLPLTETGISISDIVETASKIPYEPELGEIKTIDSGTIYSELDLPKDSPFSAVHYRNELTLRSDLASDEKEIIFDSVKRFAELGKTCFISLSGYGTLDIQLGVRFWDRDNVLLKTFLVDFIKEVKITVPDDADVMTFCWLIQGSGSAVLREIRIAEQPTPGIPTQMFLSHPDTLILTNDYPSYKELNKNMFVHQRAVLYKEAGKDFSVMTMRKNLKDSYRELEGIDVIEGGQERLNALLSDGCIRTVCVHFLDADMWEILRKHLSHLRLLIWQHGSEVQPWWRRDYLYSNDADLENAKKLSDSRQTLWREVFNASIEYDIRFVYVSEYFRDEVFSDYGISLPEEKSVIIHNCIDTNLFSYIPKDEEQRKRILSVRSYANKNYANELSVKCIELLSEKPFFDELSFRIIGDGVLFENITAPLKKFSNVILEKRFLNHEEISALHKEYGIFLTPTRIATQGVSRDEAMSSGLVPVTNAVTAIPEFTDDSCAILAPAEDAESIAEDITRLYENPELFESMSAEAAKRVRELSSKAQTIDKEISIIFKRKYNK